MTENITMKNETSNTQTRKLEFGKAFENIILFPFRVVKYAFLYGTRLISIILFIGMIALAIRAAYPMNMPEARGMTYYQFMKHRWTSGLDWVKADVEANGDPEYEVAQRMAYLAGTYALVPYGYIRISIPIVLTELFPDSKIAQYTHEKVAGNANNYKNYLPAGQVTWKNLPQSLWGCWEIIVKKTQITNISAPLTYPETTD